MHVSEYIMPCLYILAGVMHFVFPKPYIRMIPKYLPFPKFLVAISGVLEILFGLMLFFPVTRNLGAWFLIILLIAVFPANIQMAINQKKYNPKYYWLALLRLPLQLILMWWAFTYLD